MPDQFDRATDLTERERADCIERARREVADMPGPLYCLKCGDLNDRRKLGFAACWDCMEALNGSQHR